MMLHRVVGPKVLVSCGVGNSYPVWAEIAFNRHAKAFPDLSLLTWVDEFPPGSQPHHESHYGFKVHAMAKAMAMGFKQILWADSAIQFIQALDPIHDCVDKAGFFCTPDAGLLNSATRLDLFTYHQLDPSWTSTWHFMSGSVIGLDVNNPRLMAVFDEWRDQEAKGFFSPGLWPQHRHDETCLGFSLQKRGIQPTAFESSGHVLSSNPLWVSYKERIKNESSLH